MFDIQSLSPQVEVEPGDYVVDGLIYCGKCNTRKQNRYDVEGQSVILTCMCKCQEEAYEREKREHEEEQRRIDIDNMRATGFPDHKMASVRFESAEPSEVLEVAKRYVDNWKTMRENGKGLLLYGTVGTGKSYSAYCIANALIDQGIPVLVTDITRIVNTLQGKFEDRQEYIDTLNTYSLLILDDLSAERKTEYMNEMVWSIINARYRSGKPLIVTTNLSSEELANAADISSQRIYSRLFEMCIPVKVEGKDRRKEALRGEYDEYAKLLGIVSKNG